MITNLFDDKNKRKKEDDDYYRQLELERYYEDEERIENGDY